MRASILIGVHNEGDRLWRTVESVLETMGKLDAEVLVADDGSIDGSLEELKRRFPRIVVVKGEERIGVGAARGLAASRARGDVLVFLDGHTKPEAGSLQRLVSSVEKTKGEAVITPQIIGLDEATWKSHPQQIGHGYALDLETFDSWWLPLKKMREVKESRQSFFESPALVGCALAVGRELYDRLWGFDPHMRQWGNEDLDFALKAWTMGARVLHDPEATVAHRFQRDFADYEVNAEYPLANQIRSARKHFTQSVWEDWLVKAQQQQRLRLKGHPEGLWTSAWEVFQRDRQSAEHERSYLLSHRVKDEFWFARHFDRSWPAMGGAAAPVLLKQAPLPPHVLFAEAMGTPCPVPIVGGVDPESGDQGQMGLSVTISGDHLKDAGVSASPAGIDITVNSTSDGSIEADFAIDPCAPAQDYTITVTTMCGSDTGTFTVNAVAPIVTAIDPESGAQGQPFTTSSMYGPVTLTGNHLTDSTVSVSPSGITINDSIGTCTDYTLDLQIDPSATPGTYTFTVTNTKGSDSADFEVVDAQPNVTGIDPDNACQGVTDLAFTITGDGFANATVTGPTGVTVSSSSQDYNTISGTLSIDATATAGPISLTVQDANGNNDTADFTVNGVTVTGIDPDHGATGTTVDVTITGTCFSNVAVTAPSGITVSNVATASPTSVTATLQIASSISTGVVDITVTNGGGSGSSDTAQFTVTPQLQIVSNNAGGVLSGSTTTTGVSVGHEIDIKVVASDNSAISNVVWTLPDAALTVCADYDPSSIGASTLDAFDSYNDESITFYWYGTGGSVTVSVSAQCANGVMLTAQAMFNVTVPTIAPDGPITMGTAQVVAGNPPILSSGNFNAGVLGVSYSANVTGVGYSGQAVSVQLVNVDIQTYYHNGKYCDIGTSSALELDTEFPYSSVANIPANGTSNVFSDDTPSIPLSSTKTEVDESEEFMVYFMFKPDQAGIAGANSIWVPIGRFTWQWVSSATQATQNPNVWNAPTNVTLNSTSIVSFSSFPMWADVITGEALHDQEQACLAG